MRIEERIAKLKLNGASTDEAVDAIKRITAEQKKDPSKFYQPFNSDGSRNKDFYNKYGDPTIKDIGEADTKIKEDMDTELDDKFKYESGLKKSYLMK